MIKVKISDECEEFSDKSEELSDEEIEEN